MVHMKHHSDCAAMQGVSEPSLIATYDLGFLSELGWDFGTEQALDSLQIEPAIITGQAPFSVVDNCTTLQQVLSQIGANATGTALDRLLKNCATIILRPMSSVSSSALTFHTRGVICHAICRPVTMRVCSVQCNAFQNDMLSLPSFCAADSRD